MNFGKCHGTSVGISYLAYFSGFSSVLSQKIPNASGALRPRSPERLAPRDWAGGPGGGARRSRRGRWHNTPCPVLPAGHVQQANERRRDLKKHHRVVCLHHVSIRLFGKSLKKKDLQI